VLTSAGCSIRRMRFASESVWWHPCHLHCTTYIDGYISFNDYCTRMASIPPSNIQPRAQERHTRTGRGIIRGLTKACQRQTVSLFSGLGHCGCLFGIFNHGRDVDGCPAARPHCSKCVVVVVEDTRESAMEGLRR
jgi:hypothetical protein